jgi:hypothetical protein
MKENPLHLLLHLPLHLLHLYLLPLYHTTSMAKMDNMHHAKILHTLEMSVTTDLSSN